MRRGLLYAYVVGLVASAYAAEGCKKSSADVSPAEAQELFASACARCHGVSGKGGPPVWEGGPAPRDFTDHEFQAARSDGELLHVVRSGKVPGMPAFGGTLTNAQLVALVGHVRSLDAKP